MSAGLIRQYHMYSMIMLVFPIYQ